MSTFSPLSFMQRLADKASGLALQAPPWLVDEGQHRLVLLLNHVIQQEPQAQERLTHQQGKTMLVRWRSLSVRLRVTPAGLLDVDAAATPPALTIAVDESSPLRMARAALRGDKPAVRIEGDVHMAAEVNWVAENLRWDVEEDLARIVGDVPAHALARAAQQVKTAVDALVNKMLPTRQT